MKEGLILIFCGNLPNISALETDLESLGFEERNILTFRNYDFIRKNKDENLRPYIIFSGITDDHENNLTDLQELILTFPETPVVSLCTNATEDEALAALGHGAVDCLNLEDYKQNLVKKILVKIKIRKDYLKRINIENTERLKLFLQNPKPLFLIDMESGKFLNTNQAAQEKYGYCKKEFEKLNVRDIYPIEEIDKLNICLEKLRDLNKNYTHKGVWKHITKNGTEMVVEIISYRTKYLGYDVLIVMALDITEKHKVEIEKEENQKYLEAIFHNTQNGILLTDDKGKYINANEAAYKLLKYNKNELLNLHVCDITLPPEGTGKVSELWQSFKRNTRQSGTIPLKRKDGEIVFASYKAVANILPGVHLSVITDVTKSVIEQRYKELLSKIYESIFLEHDFATKQVNILRSICEYLEWDYAEFWIYSDLHDSFFRSAFYCNPSENTLEELAHKSQTIDIKADDFSLISLSIRNNNPIWIKDLKKSKNFSRRDLLPDVKQFTGMSVPLVQKFSSGTLGALTLIKTSKNSSKRDKHLMSLLKNISDVLGAEIEKLWMQDDVARVFSNSTNIYGVLSGDSTILEMNPAFLKLMNISKMEMVGEKLLRYVHPVDNNKIKKAFTACQREIREKKIEFRILTNDKNIKWLGGVLIPDHLSKRIFISGTDISDAKIANNKLELSEKHFKALVQGGSDMIAVLDRSGNYTYLSPSTQRYLHYSPEKMIGQIAYKFIHPKDIDYTKEQLENLDFFKSVITKPVRYKSGSGEWRWLESVLTNLLEDPAVKGIVVNSRDVTDRILAQQEKEKLYRDLKNYNEELLQFTYITSHNLRAPISNLIAISKLIDTSTIENPQTAKLIEGFKNSVTKLDETVNDLVKALVAREEKNVKLEKCDLAGILKDCCQILQMQIEDINPDFVIDFKKEPSILFNATYLHSIFLNLLSNALKYRSPERRLKISIRSLTDHGQVILEFSDNGLGIDLNRHKNKIFGFHQRFHEHTEGKGLGLFLTKTQITSLGGSIEVASEVDKGTKFTIKLTGQQK